MPRARTIQQERNLPPLTGEFQPRLIQARVKAGEEGIERLTWTLPADFADDKYDDWLKVEGQDQVDRSIFSAETRARHARIGSKRCTAPASIATMSLTRTCEQMAMEFDLPLELGMKARRSGAASIRPVGR